VLLCAFDLIELDGDDLGREPLVTRKATLASIVAKSPGILLNREFLGLLAGAAAACPLGVVAQQAVTSYRIGFLRNGPPPQTFIDGLRQGLRELWVRREPEYQDRIRFSC